MGIEETEQWRDDRSSTGPSRSGIFGGHLAVRRIPDEGVGAAVAESDVESDYALTGPDVILGRSPGCDVPLLSDPLVSRRHALLTSTAEGYEIIDLGSANGTLLNGAPLEGPTRLLDGDVVALGHYVITVSSLPPRSPLSSSGTHTTIPLQIYPFDDTDPQLHSVDTAVSADIEASRLETPAPPQGHPTGTGDALLPSVGLDGVAAGRILPDGAPFDGAHRALDTLQGQLVDMIQGLRQQADDYAQSAAVFRQALIQVHQVLNQQLAERLLPSSAALDLDLDALGHLARDTGSNPRHLDYMLGLTEHADELALTLEAVQRLQADGGIVRALQAIQEFIESSLA